MADYFAETPVKGKKTNNNAAPGGTNVGTLPAVANASAPTYTEGNQVALSTDLTGALRVTGGTSATQYQEDAALGATPTGTLTLARRTDTLATLTPVVDDAVSIRTNNRGALWVVHDGAISAAQSGTWTVQPGNTANTTPWLVTINQGGNAATVSAGGALKVDGSAVTQPVSGTVTANAGTGTFTTSDSQVITDNGAFTDGTSKVFMGGYVFDEVAGTALTENDAAAARVDSKRAQVLVLEDATTRGQRAAVSAAGALKVDGSAVTQPVSGTVTANAGTGTFAVNVSQINGVTPLMGNGVTGTGSQRVTIASDNTPFTVKVSKDANANAANNAIFVALSDGSAAVGTSGNPLVVTYNESGTGTLSDSGQLTSASLAAGGSANLDTAAITTGTARLIECTATSSVRIKVEVQKFVSAVATTLRTFFVEANTGFVYAPKDTDTLTFAGAAGNLWRLKITNMDNLNAADVYGTITYTN